VTLWRRYADYDRERRWPGVVFPNRHHFAGPNGYSMQKFLEANLRPNRPIVLWGGTRPGELASQTNDASLSEEEFTAFPLGLLDQVFWQAGLGAEPTPPPLSERIRAHTEAARPLKEFFEQGRAPDLRHFDKTTWEEFSSGEYWLMHHRFGYKMIFLAQSIEAAVASGDESELDDLALAWSAAEENYAMCFAGLRSTRESGVPDVMGHTPIIFQNLGLATQFRVENSADSAVADALQRCGRIVVAAVIDCYCCGHCEAALLCAVQGSIQLSLIVIPSYLYWLYDRFIMEDEHRANEVSIAAPSRPTLLLLPRHQFCICRCNWRPPAPL
jgi:hypothetical protein